MTIHRFVLGLTIVGVIGGASSIVVADYQAPIALRVVTDTGSDTLRVGDTLSLIFRVDSVSGRQLMGFTWPIMFVFTNGNTIGPLYEGIQLQFSDAALAVFDVNHWDSTRGARATSPDTVLAGFVDFGGFPRWTSDGEMWRITFVPLDTGGIVVTSAMIPPATEMGVIDSLDNVPFTWSPKHLVVLPAQTRDSCIVELTGDVNMSGTVTASDILCMVSFVFIGPCQPEPCMAAGDVNCTGTVTSADIIYTVNYIFKSGTPPCDVCPLIPTHWFAECLLSAMK